MGTIVNGEHDRGLLPDHAFSQVIPLSLPLDHAAIRSLCRCERRWGGSCSKGSKMKSKTKTEIEPVVCEEGGECYNDSSMSINFPLTLFPHYHST